MKQTKFVEGVLGKIKNFYNNRDEQTGELQIETKKVQKSQTFQPKKQQYMQNLEKRLNEITAQSFETKKNASMAIIKKQEDQQQQKEEQSRKKDKEKKIRLCRQFVKTGLCRVGESCKYAHRIQELDVEYQPAVWVNQFTHHQKAKETIIRTQSASLKRTVDVVASCYKVVDKVFILYSSFFYKKGKNKLILAVEKGDLRQVVKQLENGADPTYQDWTGNDAIIYAMKKNWLEIFSLMLDYTKDQIELNHKFFSQKQTYLIMVAKLQLTQFAQKLLESGADANVRDFV